MPSSSSNTAALMAAPAVCDASCRCAAAALPRLAPTAHLQRYLSAKVHGDSSAYSHALNALLCGLDAHKQQQPAIAVFCRVRLGMGGVHVDCRHKLFEEALAAPVGRGADSVAAMARWVNMMTMKH